MPVVPPDLSANGSMIRDDSVRLNVPSKKFVPGEPATASGRKQIPLHRNRDRAEGLTVEAVRADRLTANAPGVHVPDLL